MANGADLVARAQSQAGKKYGTGGGRTRPDVSGYSDCSGLIVYACNGFDIQIPQTSWLQARWCRDHNTLITADVFLKTPGALAFRGPNQGYDGYGANGHVVMSRGDGTTIEARGKAYGIGNFSGSGRGFSNWGLVPGVQYGTVTHPSPILDDVPKDTEVVASLPVPDSWKTSDYKGGRLRLQYDGGVRFPPGVVQPWKEPISYPGLPDSAKQPFARKFYEFYFNEHDGYDLLSTTDEYYSFPT